MLWVLGLNILENLGFGLSFRALDSGDRDPRRSLGFNGQSLMGLLDMRAGPKYIQRPVVYRLCGQFARLWCKTLHCSIQLNPHMRRATESIPACGFGRTARLSRSLKAGKAPGNKRLTQGCHGVTLWIIFPSYLAKDEARMDYKVYGLGALGAWSYIGLRVPLSQFMASREFRIEAA